MQITQLLTLTLVLGLSAKANAQLVWSEVQNADALQGGEGTFYGEGQDNQGTCSFSENFANTNDLPWSTGTALTVALNDAQFADSAACGMCIRFRGTGAGLGTTPIPSDWTNAIVNNRCPECAKGDVDLASAGDGRWDIEWYAVPCEVGSTPLQYSIVVSSYYWFSMVISNTRVPITGVSVNIGGSWLDLTRTNNNQWAYYNTNGPWQSNFPMGVRVTSIEGQTVEDTITTTEGNPGTVQFSGDGSSSTTVPSTPSSSTPPTQGTVATPPVGAQQPPASPPVQAATPPVQSIAAAAAATPPSPSSPLPEGGFYLANYEQCGGSGGSCNSEAYTATPCEDAAWTTGVCRSPDFACIRASAELYTCVPGVPGSPPPVTATPPVGSVPPPAASTTSPPPAATITSPPPTPPATPPTPSAPTQTATPPTTEQFGIQASSASAQSPPPTATASQSPPPTPTSATSTSTDSTQSSGSLSISAGGQCGGTSQCESEGTPTDKVTCSNGPWAGAYCPAGYSCTANPGPDVWTCLQSSTATAGRRLLGRQ